MSVLADYVFSEAVILSCVTILGPLLILLYFIDLLQSLSEIDSYHYGDDTCIFYWDKDVQKIEDYLNKEFSTFSKWFVDNKLSIHFREDKTKCSLVWK